jgi:glucan 1,3-beta-glucosidase
MQTPQRGVNLGGWLVLEPWITPSLFTGTGAADEYTYCLRTQDAARRLKKHRDSFIAEQDFAWLAAHNVEIVRLPIGYWLFGDELPYMGTVQYVDKAFAWAKKHHLKILLDMHGAPGSQNGEMHSGQSGAIGWGGGEPATATLQVLDRLAKRYGRHPALWGISVLNEPSPHLSRPILEDFYKKAYALLRPQCHPGTWLVFSDAFRPRRWYHRLPVAKYPRLAVDYHHYQIFTWFDRLLPASWQLWRLKHTVPGKLRHMTKHHPVVIGEWSLALPASTKVTAEQRREYAAWQQRAFDGSVAWFYWTYKTEYGGPWSFRSNIEDGLLSLD